MVENDELNFSKSNFQVTSRKEHKYWELSRSRGYPIFCVIDIFDRKFDL